MNESIDKRLKDKFTKKPKWAEDFSIDKNDDMDISRRDFIRFLSLVSLGLFTGTAGVFLKSMGATPEEPIRDVKIATLEELTIGQSKVFDIPGKREPGILVRLAEDKYVAYGQKCTHLQCPVLWKREEGKLVCPCHKGAFAVEDGRVLYGPPERALPQLLVEVKGDGIYFMGIKNGMVV